MNRKLSRFTILFVILTLAVAFFASQTTHSVNAQGGTAAATAAASGPTPTAVPLSGDPVLIGVALSQSGASAALGQDETNGANIAQDFFNYRGGINGRPIKLIIQDTASDATTAVNVFNTLIGQNVVAIVGPTLSTEAFAADPKADAAGVPVVAPSNTAKGIPQIGHYVMRVS